MGFHAALCCVLGGGPPQGHFDLQTHNFPHQRIFSTLSTLVSSENVFKGKNNEKLTNNSKYTRIRYNKVLWHSVLLSNNYAQLCLFFLILLSSLCQHTYRHNLFFCPPLCLSDFKHQSVLFDIRLLLALMCMCHLQSSNIYTDVRNSNYVTHVCVLG